MFFLILIITNLIISLLISILAIYRKVSFIKVFLLSVFLTFIIGIIYLNINTPQKNVYYSRRYKCPRCEYQFTEEYINCPLCKKEGHDVELHSVIATMT